MITGFEVGALFRLVDEMSPGLKKIMEAMRELNAEIKSAREAMAGFSGAISGGMAGAIAEVNELTAAWGRAEAASLAAARAVGGAARGAGAAAVGGGGGFRPGVGGSVPAAGGGASYRRGMAGGTMTGPGVGVPGGSRFNMSGTPALVGAGLAAFSLAEGATMEEAVWWLNYHARRKSSEKNDAQFRKIIEDTMKDTGLPMKAVAEAATDEVRMFQATPGVDAIAGLPKLLRAAAFESKAKPGTTLQAAMKSIVGMAHMVGAYTPEEIDKLLPNFAYLSIANPQSLASMERAFSYSVPTLQSGADVDPFGIAVLGTALATSGVTNTKSGTWVREMVTRSMPGDPNTKRGQAHNELLKRFGLVDENGKPTWFTNGRPDPAKALEIAGPIAAAMSPEDRLTAERGLFGAQGAGAFSVLGAPKVLARARALREGMEGNKDQYDMALEEYRGTTKQTAKSTLQEFNIAMIELGTTILPAATGALRDLSAVLQGIRSLIPGGGADKWKVGTRGIEGAVAGAVIGSVVPGVGTALGAAVGGAAGMIEGATEGTAKWSSPGKTGHPAKPMSFLEGPPTMKAVTPISLSLNVDGRTLAQSMSEQLEQLYEHATGSPNYNGQSHFGRADGGIMGT